MAKVLVPTALSMTNVATLLACASLNPSTPSVAAPIATSSNVMDGLWGGDGGKSGGNGGGSGRRFGPRPPGPSQLPAKIGGEDGGDGHHTLNSGGDGAGGEIRISNGATQ